jgi:uncharacterized protein YjbI with pentapeptide repeats
MAEPRGFLHSKTGAPILLFAALGLALSAVVLFAFQHFCRGSAADLCTMTRTNPPWLLVTGIAAAPSALLTWYWRTAHQKEEMRLRRAELNDHEQERQARRAAEAELAAERQRTAFSTAIHALADTQDTTSLVCINDVARLGSQFAEGAPQALEELALYVQRVAHALPDPLSELPRLAYDTAVTRAVTAISEIKTAHSIRRGPSLRGAILSRLDLSGLNLTGVDLHGANLCGTDLVGTKLAAANLLAIKATDAVFDHTPDLDQGALAYLRIGGATSVQEKEKAMREPEAFDERVFRDGRGKGS